MTRNVQTVERNARSVRRLTSSYYHRRGGRASTAVVTDNRLAFVTQVSPLTHIHVRNIFHCFLRSFGANAYVLRQRIAVTHVVGLSVLQPKEGYFDVRIKNRTYYGNSFSQLIFIHNRIVFPKIFLLFSRKHLHIW